MASEHEMLYAAAASEFGLLVHGDAKRFRRARDDLRDDLALMDLAILGPDADGALWLVKRDAIRKHLVVQPNGNGSGNAKDSAKDNATTEDTSPDAQSDE